MICPMCARKLISDDSDVAVKREEVAYHDFACPIGLSSDTFRVLMIEAHEDLRPVGGVHRAA